MYDKEIVVEGLRPTSADDTNLREKTWEFALDQRVFGPQQLLVAFSDPDGRFLGLAYTTRTNPAELALGPCIEHMGPGPTAAVAFCDEAVKDGPPPHELQARFSFARSIAARYGVHLVDWIACDDQLFRSARLALEPDRKWWDIPKA